MINVSLFSVVLLCGTMVFVMGKTLSANCEIPPDLNNINKKQFAVEKPFLVPVGYTSPSSYQKPIQEIITCPENLPNSGGVQNRSSCPWFYQIVEDPSLIPSVRFDAVCRCRDCIGADGMHNCQLIYSKMFFLKQISRCASGFYVYEQITKDIPTGCVCAKKRTIRNPPSAFYDI